MASQQDFPNMLSLLGRTPEVLSALLRDLPEALTLGNERDKTWNAVDVVKHLVHADQTDWMPRVRMILEFGESQTFPPFQRMPAEKETRPMEGLLDDFSSLRRENLASLQALQLRPEDLERCGRHPAFGVVTLSQLLATWATHDLTHLHQISRVIAHQYREAVGPWSAYLGVLHCNGHSA